MNKDEGKYGIESHGPPTSSTGPGKIKKILLYYIWPDNIGHFICVRIHQIQYSNI